MKEKRDDIWMELKAVVLEELDCFSEVTDELVLETIDKVLKTSPHCRTISLNRRCTLRMELFYSIRRLDVIEEHLADDTDTENMNNAETGIFHERKGRIEVMAG